MKLNMDESKKDCDVEKSLEEESVERASWGGKLDFLLSCLSYAVGLGNVWRFPFMCFKNGGAVFLIPYIIMLIFVGLPLFFMEICLGQFTSKGPVEIWEAVPLLKGIGYAMVVNSFVMAFYYVILVAYAIYYFIGSFSSVLPWATCRQGFETWATDTCYSTADNLYCQEMNENYTFINGSCHNASSIVSSVSNVTGVSLQSPSEQYFVNEVLQLSDTYEFSSISWKLSLCLLLAWIIIFICMFRGTKSFGKVVYFTSSFPYLVLTILLIKGATMPGAKNGILFYIIPDFSRLADPRVWFDAASQIFYSLGCCFGTLITFGSFNDFKKKNIGDACVVAVSNCATSLYAGFAIFGILGFMALEAGVEVKDVAKDGSGLAFIAYPQAMSQMPVSQLWSVLFFLMLLSLGLGTLFGPVEVVMTVIQDQWKIFRQYKVSLLVFLIAVLYCFGLAMTTNIGLYIFTIINDYNSIAIIIVGVAELVAVSYFYGVNNFVRDVEFMLDTKLNFYWKLGWGLTAPLTTFAILIFCFVLYQPSVYAQRPLPVWMNIIGWILVVVSVMPIPLYAIKALKSHNGSWKTLLVPSDKWGPQDDLHRKDYLKAKNSVIELSEEKSIPEDIVEKL